VWIFSTFCGFLVDFCLVDLVDFCLVDFWWKEIKFLELYDGNTAM